MLLIVLPIVLAGFALAGFLIVWLVEALIVVAFKLLLFVGCLGLAWFLWQRFARPALERNRAGSRPGPE